VKGSLPFPLFQCWKQININEAFATLFGGEGIDYRGKCVFIQNKSIIVSLKALGLQNVSTLLSMIVALRYYF